MKSTTILNEIDVQVFKSLGHEVDLNTKTDIIDFILTIYETYTQDDANTIINFLVENDITNYRLHDMLFLDFNYNYLKLVESLSIPDIPKRKWYQRLFSL